LNIVETIKKADEYLTTNQPHLALKLYFSVIDYYRRNKKKTKITRNILTAYNNAVALGLYLAETRNKLIEMRDLALEFLKVAKKSEDSEMYAIACFHAGVAHNALGEYDASTKHLKEALEVFEILGKEKEVTLACRNLAEAYENLGLKSKAEVYRLRAEALSKKLGEDGRRIMSETSSLFKKWRNIPWIIR